MLSSFKCDVAKSWAYDPDGVLVEECGADSLVCVECGGSAGCISHAQECIRCGEPLCEDCTEEHACTVIYGGKAA
jgi:hypothetical protein